MQIIKTDYIATHSERIASFAVQSLLDEVCTTPKPGLVDRKNCGSHKDMDIFTFNASAAALWPYFQRCFLTGAESSHLPAAEVFSQLQYLGLEAERMMLEATGGVNTHKGAIFTLGLMCGAAGRMIPSEPGNEPIDLALWLKTCAELARNSIPQNGTATHGDTIRRDCGIGGIREELSAGLPSVFTVGLPALNKAKQMGLNLNDCCIYTLLKLISVVRDTNMIARGGLMLAEQARNMVDDLIKLTSNALPAQEKLEELELFFTMNRLSPGGCADLLAATLLADRWTNQ